MNSASPELARPAIYTLAEISTVRPSDARTRIYLRFHAGAFARVFHTIFSLSTVSIKSNNLLRCLHLCLAVKFIIIFRTLCPINGLFRNCFTFASFSPLPARAQGRTRAPGESAAFLLRLLALPSPSRTHLNC